ncbi:MAG: tRNA 2-thiouridine(34) synthase MnmA [Candidatus Kuenenbacteria bacterium]
MRKIKNKQSKKIVVGMSGGVDSSMALVLLKKQGWQPIGVSLKYATWQNLSCEIISNNISSDCQNLLKENICCNEESFKIARDICKKLNVPYFVIDVKKKFKEKVINYFISELKNFKTPNPCIICNRYLKFQKLFEFAKKHKIKYVATGHYARIFCQKFIVGAIHELPLQNQNQKTRANDYSPLQNQNQKTNYQLLIPKDKEKDQTYSLSFLPQKWLKYIVFPLGNYLKTEVYKMAEQEGFKFFLKQKQSQDFCFVANKSMENFLKKEIGEKQGLIKDTNGNILGKHHGIHFYTIGQRKGIKLPAGPYFVVDKDVLNNILIVTKDEKKLYHKEILLSPFHFISKIFLKNKFSAFLEKKALGKIRVKAKIRYRQSLAPATLFQISKNKIKIIFNKPQKAITPGQFVVFYKNNICLGGGKIVCSL